MKALVPLTLIFRESLGELEIALADGSSARAESAGALNVLRAIVVCDEVESVAKLLAGATLGSIAELFVQASVALLEVLARSIDVILGLAVAALCDVVGTFWKARERNKDVILSKKSSPVAAVVAVSSEFLFLLEPEDDDLELTEFSQAKFAGSSDTFLAHQIHYHLVDLVDGIA
jgi:hypothetical protein